MTKAMPFLQKVILLSYDPRPFGKGNFCTFRVSYSASCMALAASMAFSWAAG